MPFVIPAAFSLAAGAGGLAAAGANNRGSKKRRKSRTELSSPGLTVTSTRTGKGKRSFDLSRSAETTSLLEGLQSRLGDTTSALRAQREQVAPGFGDITRARVQAIRDAGSRTIGNLREQLGQRRVLGSSFAQREIASQEAMFGQQEELARAEAKMQEIQLTNQLIQQEFDATFKGLTTLIDQGNFESSLLANLQTKNATNLAARQNAQDAAASAEMNGAMSAIGTVIGAYMLSDRRLKTNIKRIGTFNGLPWYEFDYIWGTPGVGVMSDEIPRRFVRQHHSGFDMVDYGALLNG